MKPGDQVIVTKHFLGTVVETPSFMPVPSEIPGQWVEVLEGADTKIQFIGESFLQPDEGQLKRVTLIRGAE